MSLQVACPSCGVAKTIPDSFAGKRLSCPRCSTQFIVQGPAASHYPPPIRNQSVLPPPSPPPSVDGPSIPNYSPPTYYPEHRPEPWFFRYVAFFAYLLLLLSMLGFCAALIFTVLAFAEAMSHRREPGGAAAAAAGIGTLVLLAWLMAAIFTSAMVLLVLDMARSFRSLRSIAETARRHVP